MANEKPTVDFGQTLLQKTLYLILPLVLSALIVLGSPMFKGVWGTVAILVLGIPLGVVTYFVSAAWGYKLKVTGSEIQINDKRVALNVPLEKIGLVVRNGTFPFPTIWIILRNSTVGQELPSKGIDPKARELIEAYQKRNPGKSLTYVPVPGGHLRSLPEFIGELKRRIPPLTVDDRLPTK